MARNQWSSDPGRGRARRASAGLKAQTKLAVLNVVGAAAVLAVLMGLCLASYSRLELGAAPAHQFDGGSARFAGAASTQVLVEQVREESDELASRHAGAGSDGGALDPVSLRSEAGAWSARHRRAFSL